jgi:hypothetical protein
MRTTTTGSGSGESSTSCSREIGSSTSASAETTCAASYYATFVIRPAPSTRYFVAAGFTEIERADRIEVLVEVDAGKTATFEICRLAYLG